MVGDGSRVEVTVASRRESWQEAYAGLRERDPGSLSGQELDGLAEAAWWLCRLDESLAARRRAYTAHAADGDHRRAALAAFHLADNHLYLGQRAVALGWLRRAQRHLASQPECPEHGLLAVLEADMAQQEGRLDEAHALALHAAQVGQRCRDPELIAVAIQTQGRVMIEKGHVVEGSALLDEAMVSVLADELGPFFTGWIYCQVIAACLQIGDLRRASEWTDAARQWCEAVPADAPYPALCRVNRAELATMRGALREAASESRKAAEQLLAYHRPMAAAALYALGEALRRLGDLRASEDAFEQADRLGWNPQPGLALLRLAQGKLAPATAGIHAALQGSTGSGLARMRLLAAQVDVALANGDKDTARAAAEELGVRAARLDSTMWRAVAERARGAVLLQQGDPLAALPALRQALEIWQQLDAAYDEAHVRRLLGLALLAVGDSESGRRELENAALIFRKVGAAADERRVAAELISGSASRGGLTQREVQVLRLVAEGKSNRQIAGDLSLSEHTVARHLQNIFNKLDVSSRAAATAFAIEHGLV